MIWFVLIKNAYIFYQIYDVKKGFLVIIFIFGLVFKDIYFLRDDEVSVDKSLEIVFVDSSVKVRMIGNGGQWLLIFIGVI